MTGRLKRISWKFRLKQGNSSADLVKTRNIPEQDLWFEKVWKDYLEDNFVDD